LHGNLDIHPEHPAARYLRLPWLAKKVWKCKGGPLQPFYGC
jgi:hypothetical protein